MLIEKLGAVQSVGYARIPGQRPADEARREVHLRSDQMGS